MSYAVMGKRLVNEQVATFPTREDAQKYIEKMKKEMVLGESYYSDFFLQPRNYMLVGRYISIGISHRNHLGCGDTIYAEKGAQYVIDYFETLEEVRGYMKANGDNLRPELYSSFEVITLKEIWLLSDEEQKLLFTWKANEANDRIIEVQKANL